MYAHQKLQAKPRPVFNAKGTSPKMSSLILKVELNLEALISNLCPIRKQAAPVSFCPTHCKPLLNSKV